MIERRLTSLLSRWADAYRLRDDQAAAIRRAILAAPGLPDFDWWWNLLDPEHGVAFRGVQDGLPSLTIAPAAVTSWQPWTASFGEAGAWQQPEAPDYAPYLRLS